MSPLNLDNLYTFHAQERKIFSKLVLSFARAPAESLLVMAIWLWLEDFGYANILSTIRVMADPLIAALAKEAVSCLQCLESKDPPNDLNQIPLTAKVMQKAISLPILYKHRYTAITGIKNFLTTVCSRIFSDILQQVLPHSSSSSSSFFSTEIIRSPLIIPGFPHPTFGGINVMPPLVVGDNLLTNNFVANNLPSNPLFFVPDDIWGWNACIATPNERTMFITFSRGFPVTKAEVKKLFTETYGKKSVESIFMGEDTNVNNNVQQPLFARVVLDSVTTVDCVLKGESVRKLMINGKHIWVRKYEEREWSC